MTACTEHGGVEWTPTDTQGDWESDLDSWVQAITRDKLQIVGFDMIGLCKFSDPGHSISTPHVTASLKGEHGIDVTPEDLAAAVRRAFLRGLALERRQGYEEDEYALPAEVTEDPNPHIKVPNVTSPKFFDELSRRVWRVFEPEMEGLV